MKKVAKLGFYGMMKMKTVKKFNRTQERASIYFLDFQPKKKSLNQWARFFVLRRVDE